MYIVTSYTVKKQSNGTTKIERQKDNSPSNVMTRLQQELQPDQSHASLTRSQNGESDYSETDTESHLILPAVGFDPNALRSNSMGSGQFEEALRRMQEEMANPDLKTALDHHIFRNFM